MRKSISDEDEKKLIRIAQQGGELGRRAAGLVVSRHEWALVDMCKKHLRYIEFDEVMAWAREGLFEAVRRFDPNSENKFLTYAVWWIRQRINAGLWNEQTVKNPIKVWWKNNVNYRKTHRTVNNNPQVCSFDFYKYHKGILPPDLYEFEARKDLENLIDRADLDKKELAALRHSLLGMTTTDSGNALGKSREWCRTLRVRAVKKITREAKRNCYMG